MTRQAVVQEVKASFGIIPGFVEQMSDDVLMEWWDTARNFLMVDTALPVKTKALIGLGAASTARCRY